ncbi:hypothetical protein C7B61_00085 [filamentous cyanobacterium CCP1]|nr:hypothetical protein C7B61_00085 [filamentous cyanobacterium CCP1]
MGASPFMVLSEKKYINDQNARTLWGATLSHVFKYKISGNEFKYIDAFPLSKYSIHWNIYGMRDESGGRIITHEPRGLRSQEPRSSQCAGGNPAVLVFKDGRDTDSKIECIKKLEVQESAIKKLCKVPTEFMMNRLETAAFSTVLPTGQVAVKIKFDSPDKSNARLYTAIADNNLDGFMTCAYVDDSTSSNAVPSELIAEGVSAMYWPTENGIVKMTYNAHSNELSRLWRQDYKFRGRTGTTPTLVGNEKDRFVVVIDAKCAVSNPLTGKIVCDKDDQSPTKLVAIRRDQENVGEVITFELPDYIKTVENSPSASGYTVVIANYSGYGQESPSGRIADASEKGVVAVSWLPAKQNWELAWENPNVQMNGITTISTGSNMVYSSGVEEGSRTVYMYGVRFKGIKGKPGGEVIFRKPLGPDALFLDQGNNTLINDDGSLIYSSTRGVVRIFERHQTE